MPNGKGLIDCCYCIHFESESGYKGADAMYEKGFCRFHKAEIPSTLPSWYHRICSDFVPSNFFERYLQYDSLEQKFERFEKDLEKNTLYKFSYNVPSEIEKMIDL